MINEQKIKVALAVTGAVSTGVWITLLTQHFFYKKQQDPKDVENRHLRGRLEIASEEINRLHEKVAHLQNKYDELQSMIMNRILNK